jgi:hypothetical protein
LPAHAAARSILRGYEARAVMTTQRRGDAEASRMSRAPVRPEDPLDDFIPCPDVRERFATTVRAPGELVLSTALQFDLQRPLVIRAIFRARELLMGSGRPPPRVPRGLLEELRALGWGVLVDIPGRELVCGAVCQPWLADVRFRPLPPSRFATDATPGHVKIAWTLEVEALGPERCRLLHETRAVATDADARSRFLPYWRWARFGIVAIRRVLLPSVRRAAEREWRRRRGP